MKKRIQILFWSLLMMTPSCKFTDNNPVPSPSPIESPSPTASASPGSAEVKFSIGSDTGSNVDKVFARKALDIAEKHIASGCLKDKFLKRTVTSLHNIEGTQVKTKQEAYDRFISGAPYSLDLRWYYKRFSSVIGYTYNWLEGLDEERCYNALTCPTETRIYSNTNAISGYSEGDYAAHLMHELSHQARAGGFVHWTVFDGTVPYELGYAMQQCVDGN